MLKLVMGAIHLSVPPLCALCLSGGLVQAIHHRDTGEHKGGTEKNQNLQIVKLNKLRHIPSQIEFLFNNPAPGLAQLSAQFRIARKSFEPLSSGDWISSRHKKSRHTLANQFGYAANLRGHARFAVG